MAHARQVLDRLRLTTLVMALLGVMIARHSAAIAEGQVPAQDPRESQPPSSSGSLPVGITGSTPAPVEEVLPTTVPELLDLLRARGQEARDLIKNRELTSVYVPALRSKAVALALENHIDTLPVPQQSVARRAIKQLVVSAWQLDYAGDAGNVQTAEAIFADLESAISSLQSAYASAR